MARILSTLLTAAALLACGSSEGPAPGPALATVSGTVRVSPCRPVERVGDPPCQPVPGIAIEFIPSGGGSSVGATTDGVGRYSVSLRAGTYQARAARGIGRGSQVVTVGPGQQVQLDLTLDVGIR